MPRLPLVGSIAGLMLACASAHPPDPDIGRAWPASRIMATVVTSSEPAVEASRIGKADLEQARKLLSRARHELAPRQWELLDRKLTEAEGAWERFNTAARASGKTAEVARGVEGIAEAARASEAVEGAAEAGGATETAEGIAALSSVAPLLVILVALWPSSTAGPDVDHGPPDWVYAKVEFEARLKDASQAAQQVRSELETTRRDRLEAAKRNRPPRPNEVRINDKNWMPVPGQSPNPPCIFTGGAEPGLPPGWIRCTYVCGKYRVILYDVFGSTSDECKKWVHFERARKEAENWAPVHDKGR